jgi:endogenous inhibitor of DNA gyrase (YacG/DUF329 family)
MASDEGQSGQMKPGANAPRRANRRCPICGGATAMRYRPFCSARCAELDLAGWLKERYRVPGDLAADPTESEETEPS